MIVNHLSSLCFHSFYQNIVNFFLNLFSASTNVHIELTIRSFKFIKSIRNLRDSTFGLGDDTFHISDRAFRRTDAFIHQLFGANEQLICPEPLTACQSFHYKKHRLSLNKFIIHTKQTHTILIRCSISLVSRLL